MKEQYRGEDRDTRKDRRAEERAIRLRRRGSGGMEKLERRVSVANRLEYNATEDLIWVVVLTAEQGKFMLLAMHVTYQTDIFFCNCR
jgi:hypothetical protein